MYVITIIPNKLTGYVITYLTFPGVFLALLSFLKTSFEWNGLIDIRNVESDFLRYTLWYLVFDGAYYLAHYLLHKFPILWNIHKLHHSATEMNIITGNRTSFAEKAFNSVVVILVTTFIFGYIKIELFFGILFARTLLELIQHSDIPWDFGPMKYLFVSPMFHKIHHSSIPLDYNSNYSNIFPFWDFLFGTVSKRYLKHGASISKDLKIGLHSE